MNWWVVGQTDGWMNRWMDGYIGIKKPEILEKKGRFNWFNPLAYKGEGGCPHIIRFFLNISKMIFHQHLPFSVAVRIYLKRVLTQDW